MRTIYLGDVPALTKDDELMRELDQTGPCPADRSSTLAFGIEGRDGEVYRVIETHGLWETVRAFDLLRSRGLRVGPGRPVGDRKLSRVFREP